MKFAVLALTLLLAVASQAASVPEEPSEIQVRFSHFKSMVAQSKDILDSAIASTPDAQQLQTPSYVSAFLGSFSTMLQTHEEVIVASISAGYEIVSQMTGAGELFGELQAGVANLDTVLKAHLAEYNVLVRPIITDFKQMSMQFKEVAAPKIVTLRNEFQANARETINALGPVVRTLLKMAGNFRDSVSMYTDEYRRMVEEARVMYDNLSEEEKARRLAEIEGVWKEITNNVQKLYDVALAAPAPSR